MDFKTKPYAHQLEAFEKFKDKEFFALFMDMGTGKTKVAIDIAAHKYEKGEIDAMLIIAPNHVHTQWITEQFILHCPVPYKAFIWKSSKRGTHGYQYQMDNFLTPKIDKLKVFTVNVEAFQSDTIIPTIRTYVKHNKVFTVVDESTRIKNPKAKRTKTIHKLEKYGQRCILTGTPATKSPFGLWSMFEFLKKGFFECNYFIFQARHGVMMNGINQRTGGRYRTLIDEKTWHIVLSQLKEIQEIRNGPLMSDDYLAVAEGMGVSEKNVRFIEYQKEFKKYKRLDEIKEKISAVTFYARKEDCLDLPDKVYQPTFVEMHKDHRKIYNNLKKTMLAEYAGEELTVTNKAALTTRLMQVCGGYFPYTEEVDVSIGDQVRTVVKVKAKQIGLKNQKIERIKEELEELSSFPVIIWARFVVELQAIYAALKKDYKCCLYYGKTPAHERADIIEDFKAGDYDIFIGNPAVAGFGLNLQNATTQLFYSNSYDVEARLQAEDRSHRLGVKDTCLYKDFAYKNTIDERIARAILSGKAMNDFFRQPLEALLDDEEKEVKDNG
jgi:SNF2 family DNA or RNA helicase